MQTQLFQAQYYRESWHVAKNEQRHAHYCQRVIYTIGMPMNTLTATCQLLIKNVHYFLLYIAEQFYVNYKMAPE